REFIKGYQPLIGPLLPYLKKDAQFDFHTNDEALQCFHQLKLAITTDAVLYWPDYLAAAKWKESGKPFVIFVDACNYGVGATLAQAGTKDGTPRPIAVFSRSLNATQRRWDVWHKELYAVWWALRVLYKYTKGFHL